MFPADPVLASTLQNPDQLFEQLGTFWRAYLSDVELLRYHEWARLQLHGDVYLRAVELAAAAAIQQVRPFVARQWRLIRLLESELSNVPNVIRYGSGRVYGDGSVYGQISSQSYTWSVSADIQEIGLLIDRIIDPQHVYDVSNCTFDPARAELRFTSNPFDELEVLPVYAADGTLMDRQVLLWARNVQEDENVPYLRYGAVLGLEGASSEDYVQVLRSCWAMLVKGPSVAELTRGLMASVGLRFTEGDETVEVVDTDTDGLAIVTDKRVYRFHADATPLVAVGDALEPGQALTDTVQVFDYSSGRPRDYSAMTGLAMGPELGNLEGTIVFPNVDESFAPQANGDVQFTLYGDQNAIDAFWEGVHARGVTDGSTLAEIVDVQAPGVVKPVNPMKFVIDNVIGSNLIVVAVKPQHFMGFEPGYLVRIKSLINAGTLLLVQINLDTITDVLNLESAPAVLTVYDAILAPTDVATVSGLGLVFSDYMPLITVT